MFSIVFHAWQEKSVIGGHPTEKANGVKTPAHPAGGPSTLCGGVKQATPILENAADSLSNK